MQTADMRYIRAAAESDCLRIAEIYVTNYRLNFYPFFRDDAYYFNVLNTADCAAEFRSDPTALAQTFVYDDGAVKGFIRVCGQRVDKLFVEPVMQGGGIGAALLQYAVEILHADRLWALAYNTRGIAFYRRHGFLPSGAEMTEDGIVPLIELRLTKGETYGFSD